MVRRVPLDLLALREQRERMDLMVSQDMREGKENVVIQVPEDL